MNQPQKQHLVPKFYLKNFAGPSPHFNHDRVLQYEIEGGKNKLMPPKTASVIDNFYTYSNADDSFIVENQMEKIESPITRMIDDIESRDWPFRIKERRDRFARFMALMHLRGAGTRKFISEFHQVISNCDIQTVKKHFEKAAGKELDENEVKRYVESLHAPSVDHDLVVHSELLLRWIENATESIRRRPWTLLDFGSRHLITGDRPLCVSRDYSGGTNLAGIDRSDVLMFPVTPTKAIYMGQPSDNGLIRWGQFDKRRDGNNKEAITINHHVAQQSTRLLFCLPQDAIVIHSIPDEVIQQELLLDPSFMNY